MPSGIGCQRWGARLASEICDLVSVTLHSFTVVSIRYNIIIRLMTHLRRYHISILLALLLSLSVEAFAQSSRRMREHEVQREETVYSISRRYNTSVERIYELNPWAKRQIKVGDKLLIPTDTTTNILKVQERMQKHRVEAGETLYRITKIYGIELSDLLRANPGVTSANVQVGMELNIPLRREQGSEAEETRESEHRVDSVASRVASAPTRVLILLPLTKGRRYIEFYEGFLLGMYDLKRAGISIQLTALDVPNVGALQSYIATGQLADKDLVIGGVDELQIRAIAEASGYSYYVVPFSRIDGLTPRAGRIILANAHSADIVERTIPFFLQRYKGREVVFTRRAGDTEEPFVTKLRPALKKAGISARTITIGSDSPTNLGSNTVVVPVGANQALAQATINLIGERTSGITLFGYPQWQSYGSPFQQSLHRLNATIYTSFFFDPTSSESKDFLTQYNTWFGHKIDNTYPKYSVLGYDLARYFIRSYATYGKGFVTSNTTPYSGLQLDLFLQPTQEGVYTNTRFYMVTYSSTGSIQRESI